MMMYRRDDLRITSQGLGNVKRASRCTTSMPGKHSSIFDRQIAKGMRCLMKKINIIYHEDRRIDQCQIKGTCRSDIYLPRDRVLNKKFSGIKDVSTDQRGSEIKVASNSSNLIRGIIIAPRLSRCSVCTWQSMSLTPSH